MIALALAAALAASAQELAWMAGSWATGDDGVVVRETWLAPIDGVMAGAGQTNAPGRPASIEFMKISEEPGGLTFTAHVRGQPATAFVLVSDDDDSWVFENPAHDMPQRVIYSRCGDDLCARIEGVVDGEPQSQDWRYSRIAP